MCYNSDCHTSGIGAFCFHKQRHCGQSEYSFWAKRPVLSDSRPAACVTAVADSTGRFAMTKKNGKPCIKCGGTEWYKDGKCIRCAKERARRWHLANPDKVKEISRRWNHANSNKVKETPRQWQQANPEKAKENDRRWRQTHPDKAKECTLRWRQAHPEAVAASQNIRRTRKTQAGGSYTAAEFLALCDHYGNKCLCCGRDDVRLTADHITPVAKGGTSNIDNIQPLCQPCNTRKNDKTIDYRPSKGFGWWVQKKLFGG